jgi:hypothetical protein
MQNISRTKVYLKGTLPAEYHYGNNRRIGQIVALVDEGYKLTEETSPRKQKGTHGYNNSLESMRAIFMARGPNFQVNKTLEPFQNIHVYSLMCQLLEINCQPNNGSFKTFESIYRASSSASSVFSMIASGFTIAKAASIIFLTSFLSRY